MVPIMNVPFLARTMERLYEAGIRDVILPAGYMPQAIVDYFGDGSRARHEDHVRDRGDAARHRRRAQERRGAHHRPVLRAQRRRAHQPRPARDARRYHERRAASARCTSSASTIRRRSAASCTTATAAITAFVEKPPKGDEPTNEINAGTYLLEREVLDTIPAGRNVSIERETFPDRHRRRAKRSTPTPPRDYWIDLGRPEQYLAAHRDVLSRRDAARARAGTERATARRPRRPSRRRRAGPCRRGRRDRPERPRSGPTSCWARDCSDRRRCRGPRLGAVGARQRWSRRGDRRGRSSRAAATIGPTAHASGRGSVIGHDTPDRAGADSRTRAAAIPAARPGSKTEVSSVHLPAGNSESQILMTRG